MTSNTSLLTKNSQFSTLNSQLTLEVHLFDFDGDLYGKTLKVWFLDRIRDEEKFSGLEALKAQLEIDREKVKQYFLQNTF